MNRALVALLVLTVTACRKPAGGASGTGLPTPTAAWLEGRLPREASQGTPKPGGAFVVRVANEPAGLTRVHDQQVEGTMVRYTQATVYETLARPSREAPDGPLEPLLAEAWVESADHLTLTIHLRSGVTFHDGAAFSARDVKAVVDAILNPQNPTASARSSLTTLEALETPDPLTVVVKWRSPHCFASRSFLGALPIMPAGALAGDFNTLAIHRAPIGTGPFRFERWESGRCLSFVRNDSYWGRKAWLDRVVLRFVKDETVATSLWQRGEFDLMTRITPSVWRALEAPAEANRWAVTGYDRVSYFDNNYGWVGWNEQRPFFADPRVRRALAMLYPAQTVATAVDLGLEVPTTCPYARGAGGCDPTVTPIAFDPGGAAKLLAEAGWVDSNEDGVRDRDGVPFKFTFLAVASSVKQGKVLPLYKEELARAGIEMDLERVDAALQVARLRAHDFDAAMLSWSSLDTQQDQFQLFHASQSNGGSNYVSYANPQVDALLERIRTEFDPARRQALERQVHRLLYADQVYLFLTVRPQLDAVKREVRGLAPSPAWYDFTSVWLSR